MRFDGLSQRAERREGGVDIKSSRERKVGGEKGDTDAVPQDESGEMICSGRIGHWCRARAGKKKSKKKEIPSAMFFWQKK